MRRVALLFTVSSALVAPGAEAQDYRFPASEAQYALFYPTAYKDHAGQDWACGAIRYDGHRGSDFGAGGFSGMDAGRDIVAAAPGVVIEAHDGEFDRCTSGSCAGGGVYGNHVWIQHPDGKATLYGHLRQWSVTVEVGDYVGCGDRVGQMGSSGYSTGPHIHFGVLAMGGVYHDPFWGSCSNPPTYWVGQGAYRGLPAVTCPAAPPRCQTSGPLECGATVRARSDGAGSTSVHGYYGCGTHVYSGPERAYTLSVDRASEVTVRLTGLGADLDLYLLGSDACDARDCLGASTAGSTSDESITFRAGAATSYVVVVDGFRGATSAFSLSASCVPLESDGGAPDGGLADAGAPAPVDAGLADADGGAAEDGGAAAEDGGAAAEDGGAAAEDGGAAEEDGGAAAEDAGAAAEDGGFAWDAGAVHDAGVSADAGVASDGGAPRLPANGPVSPVSGCAAAPGIHDQAWFLALLAVLLPAASRQREGRRRRG